MPLSKRILPHGKKSILKNVSGSNVSSLALSDNILQLNQTNNVPQKTVTLPVVGISAGTNVTVSESSGVYTINSAGGGGGSGIVASSSQGQLPFYKTAGVASTISGTSVITFNSTNESLNVLTSVAGDAGLMLRNTNAASTANGLSVFDESDSRRLDVGYNNNTNESYIWSYAADVPLKIATNSTERMRILAGGNVGIGATTPAAKLEVLSTTEQLRLTHTDASKYTTFTQGANDFTIRNEGSGDDIIINPNDKVQLHANGINYATTADTPYLYIQPTGTDGGDGANIFNLTAGQNITIDSKADTVFKTDGTEELRIASNLITLGDGVVLAPHSSDDFTIDSPNDIVLDYAGNNLVFKSDGTTFGKINNNNAYWDFDGNAGDSYLRFIPWNGGAGTTAYTYWGDGTHNQVIFLRGTDSIGTNSTTLANTYLYQYDSAGNLDTLIQAGGDSYILNQFGLGTSNPSYQLDVYSDTSTEVARFKNTSTNGYVMRLDAGDGSNIRFQTDHIIASQNLHLMNNNANLYVRTAGYKFGVGTSSPATAFHVSGTNIVSRFQDTTGVAFTDIKRIAVENSYAATIAGGQGQALGTTADAYTDIWTNKSRHISFRHATGSTTDGATTYMSGSRASSEYLKFKTTGNNYSKGGIISAPNELYIITESKDMSLNSANNLTTHYDREYVIYNDTGNPVFHIRSGSSAAIEFEGDGDMRFKQAGTSTKMSLTSAGNLGIGTTNPDYKLHLKGAGTTEQRIETTESGAYSRLQFRSHNTGGYAQVNFGDNGADAAGYLMYYHGDDSMTMGSSGDLLLDVAGDITLDAAGSDIKLSKAGGNKASFYLTSSDVYFQMKGSDADFFITGISGSTQLTALSFDMSESARATFNTPPVVGTMTAGDNTTKAASTAFVTAAVTAAGGGDVSKSGTPVDNQLAIWTGTNTIEGNANLIFDGTNLNPKENLLMENDKYIKFYQNGGSTYHTSIGYNSSNELQLGGLYGIQLRTYSNGWGNRVTIASDGDVGIGTVGPTRKLDVRGTTLLSGGTLITGTLEATGKTTITNELQINGGGDSNHTHMNYQNAGTNYISQASSGSTIFRGDSGNTNLRIMSDGDVVAYNNLGIGSTNPSYPLHVVQNSGDTYGMYLFNNGSKGIYFGDTNNDGTGYGKIGGVGGSLFLGSTQVYTSFIPTSDSSATLGQSNRRWSYSFFRYGQFGYSSGDDENSGSGGYVLGVSGNADRHPFMVKAYGDEGVPSFIVTSGSNVGIGMTTPSQALSLPDNAQIALGNNPDLKIYHNGSHSFIQDQGTGELRLLSSKLSLMNASEGAVLTMDGSTNRIGIGTTSPNTLLEVLSTTNEKVRFSYDASNYLGFAVNSGGDSQLEAKTGHLTLKTDTAAHNIRADSKGDFRVDLGDSAGTYSMRVRAADSSPILMAKSNGNVGIGTESPNSELDVFGDIRITNKNGSNPTDAGSLIFEEAGDNWGSSLFGFRINLEGSSNYLNFQSANQSTIKDVLTLTRDTARVGIGTTSPDDLLHVLGGDVDPSIKLQNNRSGHNGYYLMEHRGSSLKLQSTGSTTVPMRFVQQNTDVMIVSGSNVGIGEMTPPSRLSISGDGTKEQGLMMSGDDGTNYLSLYVDAVNPTRYFKLQHNSTYGGIQILDSAGNRDGYFWADGSGPGLAPPNGYSALQVLNGAGGSAANTITYIYGKTGIGTTGPNEKLEVNGNAIIDGHIYMAGTLQHYGDTDTYIGFTGNDTIEIQTGGASRISVNDAGVLLGNANARVTTILDEDNMASNSATALATQQSIKAYVDANAGGGGIGGSIANTQIAYGNGTDIAGSANLTYNGTKVDIAQTADDSALEIAGYDDKSGVTAKLHVRSNGLSRFLGSADAQVQSAAGSIYLSSVEHMYLDVGTRDTYSHIFRDDTGEFARFKNARLGIGTTNPSTKLHVVGDALIDGYLHADKDGSPGLLVGEGGDADIYYDGSNMFFNAARVGTGKEIHITDIHASGASFQNSMGESVYIRAAHAGFDSNAILQHSPNIQYVKAEQTSAPGVGAIPTELPLAESGKEGLEITVMQRWDADPEGALTVQKQTGSSDVIYEGGSNSASATVSIAAYRGANKTFVVAAVGVWVVKD